MKKIKLLSLGLVFALLLVFSLTFVSNGNGTEMGVYADPTDDPEMTLPFHPASYPNFDLM